MVTPMTQRLFGFGELANSLMYSLCGAEVILGFFLVRWLSRRVADRAVLAAGLLICCTACIWCLVFLTSPRGANPSETHTHAHTGSRILPSHVGPRLLQLVAFIALITSDRCCSRGVPEYT